MIGVFVGNMPVRAPEPLVVSRAVLGRHPSIREEQVLKVLGTALLGIEHILTVLLRRAKTTALR